MELQCFVQDAVKERLDPFFQPTRRGHIHDDKRNEQAGVRHHSSEG